MSEYYNIVPWYNSEEWHIVYQKIFSEKSSFQDKEEALNSMILWKARCPSMPSGIESTLMLLEVHLQSEKSTTYTNDQLLRLAYSSAIMRFVNHMLDSETAKGTSLYQAAKSLGVPDWIIDLRHDTAHSNNLPSIELLKEAAVISLEWLQKHYWDKYKQYINDFICGQKNTGSTQDSKMGTLVEFCISLGICVHSKCKFKNILDIKDIDMRESIINNATELFGDKIDFSSLRKVSITSLVNKLNSQAKTLLQSKDVLFHINEALLGEDSILLSQELLHYFNNEDFYRKNKFSRGYTQCFEVLLTFLHSNDLIYDFLVDLIQVTQVSENDVNKCQLAATWVSEILKAFKKSQKFLNKVEKVDTSDDSLQKRKELISLYKHWFPNDKASNLLLDLQKPPPSELMDIHSIQPIITSYNPYLTQFVQDLLNLVEPPLPEHVSQRICKLAELISIPSSKFPGTSPNKIYTVDDLVGYRVNSSKQFMDNSLDRSFVNATSKTSTESNKHVADSIWKLASEEGWATCPIGMLPQQIVNVGTEPEAMDTA